MYKKVKKYRRYSGSEDDMQISLARYLDSLKVLWHHPANERQLQLRVSKKGAVYSPLGMKLKRKGVKKGVPDIMIFEPRGIYNGLALEIKTKYNKPTPEQVHWCNELNKRKYLAKVTWSLDEAIDIIDRYLKL